MTSELPPTDRRFTRRQGLAALGASAVAGLAGGCAQVGFGPGAQEPPLAAPTTPVQSAPLAGAPAGATIGAGPVRVGLVLPLTSQGAPSVIGGALRNAVELAHAESGSGEVTFLVKDDQSTPDGARAAAQQALSEGAEMFVGPLFAGNVKEVGRIARAANRPVIGFSTDATAAARGVYLLSFLIESYVDRIVDYAAGKGRRAIAALAPDNDYGRVALAEFQSFGATKGVRVVAIEQYTSATLNAAAAKIAALGNQIDALFVPEQGDGLAAVAQAIANARIDVRRVQILGAGLWSGSAALKAPALQGAWFSAPEGAGFSAFAQRYRAKFNADPPRIATLAYDAASLAGALARAQGSQRFAESVLTSPAGFNGADGVFRFRADGLNERGLAVMQVSNGGATTIAAAPRSFGAAT
ncbi:MAG: penicillin-binding protein activator [Methylobacteriaceae bacterium]|nr:penicillin-binding protein activator [Methylobacteriaceae bacterium]